MVYSATRLRQNLYNILDSVIENGIPVSIERNGHILKIIPDEPKDFWDRLEPHDVIRCDPESIVSIEWSDQWKEGDNL